MLLLFGGGERIILGSVIVVRSELAIFWFELSLKVGTSSKGIVGLEV